MNRIVTVTTQKSMTQKEFELWKDYLTTFELLTSVQIESLCQSGKLITTKAGTTATYTVEQVN